MILSSSVLVLVFTITCVCDGAVVAGKEQTLSCKDPKGKDVEWFIIYKMSKTDADKNVTDSQATEGVEMAYVDANSKGGKFELLDKGIDEEDQPVAYTLAPLYQGSAPEDIAYAAFSDQVPDEYSGTAAGHSKGVLMFDEKQGVWLTHSVPRFPGNLFKKYQYSSNGRVNGQVLMCVTVPIKEIDTVVEHLKVQFPKVYEGGMPDCLKEKFPDLQQIIDGKNFRKVEKLLVDTIYGVRGTEFISFAKHHSLDVDVYSGAIAPKLDVDLLVQTWRNGAGGKLPSSCPANGVTVTNMANALVSFGNKKHRVTFSTRSDHSKFAISDDAKKPWFCVSSINRMLSQSKRGGETLCIKHKNAHKVFASVVDKCDTCDRLPSKICKRHEEI